MKFNDIKNSIAGRKPKEETGKGLKPGAKGPEEKQSRKENTKRPEIVLDEELQKILDAAPVDDKGRKIVPDDVFDNHYRDLPQGIRNETGNKLTANKGYITMLGADPEKDKEIQRQGAEALNARNAQRRSLADTLDVLLRKKARPEDIAEYDLPDNATYQDAIMAAIMAQAAEGNVKAGQFVRDTIGEQPTSKQDIAVTMSDDDRKLLEQVEKRLKE